MTDRDALYRAVLAHPDDDTPRLVYADALEEHGRAEEAEFIRLGCRLEAAAPDHPEYADWLARREELQLWLAAHTPGPDPRFPAGLRLPGKDWWWHNTRRGFPRYLEFDGDGRPGLRPVRALAAALERAFAAVPTRMLVVRFVTAEQLAELLLQPVVGRLDALTLQFRFADDTHEEVARLLAACPRLGNLRGLILGFDPGEAGIAALAASPHLGRLERLTLEPDALSPAAVRALGAGGWFRHLRGLTLGNDRLAPESFEELCRLAPFPRLHTLDLGRYYGGNTFPVEAWRAFARSAAFPALARLELARTDLGGGRAAALAGAKWLRPAHLDLSNCAVGNDGAAALAAAPWLGAVRWLGLPGNLLTPAGVRAVAGSRAVAGLGHLDLSYNALGVSALRAAARNPALRNLHTLLLRGHPHHNNQVAPAHFHEFLSALDLPALRHLDLGGRPVGPRAARLLAADKFRSLTRLGLEDCGVSDRAAAALLSAPALQNLIGLDLRANRLRDGVKPLADPRTMPRLSAGRLDLNRVTEALAARIARPGLTM